MSAGHDHAIPNNQNEKMLWWALGLTTTFLVVEGISGLIFNSLALLSDAAHMFTDAAALGIALTAVRIARRPANKIKTYGYHRFEILAAAFNALLLFGVAIYIIYEAVQRILHPSEVQSVGMLVVAIFGLLINLVSMRLLSTGKEKSLNLKGAYLEVWSDMLGSLGVIAGAVIIYFTAWTWIDTVVAIAIGLWVLPRTWILLKESLNLLLEGVPQGLDLEQVETAILSVPNVTDVHDLHVWGITSGKNSLTAHVVHVEQASSAEIIKSVNETLSERFDIHHTTLQCEIIPCNDANACNLNSQTDDSQVGHAHSH